MKTESGLRNSVEATEIAHLSVNKIILVYSADCNCYFQKNGVKIN